jgi:hypothetical protein
MTRFQSLKAVLVGAGVAAVLAAGASHAQPAPPKRAPPLAPKIEPAAVQALARMSAFLRSNQAFQVTSTALRDEVDAYGQNVTLGDSTTYRVRAPNAFAIELSEGNSTRDYVYDGKTVTVYDPKTGFYAQVAAAPTIRQTLDLAEAKYGLTVPLDDLFHWDQSDDYTKKLTSAHFVDKAKVAGQDADHYAFRQLGVDWQIWIAAGARPLPLRVTIVASQDPARPRFQADLAWDTDPKFTAETFAFTPPPGARPIPIASNP